MFKTTKSRLVLAALALLVCVSMFVGSTFAWFTDSVSSVNNIIKSGNLDIEVQYSLDGTTWNDLAVDTPIFSADDLWEPGHTVVAALRIKNVGSLAAKLDVATDVVNELEGTNVYEESFKLSDYLEVYTGNDASAIDFDDRAGSLAGLTAAAFGQSLFATDVELLPGNSTDCVIGITMPTTVGNVANHKTGTAAPQITFGITVNATQQMYEEDSFGDDYDEDATYPEAVQAATAADLKDVFENGGTATLTADVDMATSAVKNERLTIPEGETVVLDLAGNTLTSKDGGGSNTMAIYISRGATLILNDSVGGGEINASCYGVYVQPGATFIMNGGTINVSGNGVYDIGVSVWNSEFVMNGGAINSKFAVWPSNYWKNNGETAAPTCKVTIADGCTINSTSGTDIALNDAADTILDIPASIVTNPAA